MQRLESNCSFFGKKIYQSLLFERSGSYDKSNFIKWSCFITSTWSTFMEPLVVIVLCQNLLNQGFTIPRNSSWHAQHKPSLTETDNLRFNWLQSYFFVCLFYEVFAIPLILSVISKKCEFFSSPHTRLIKIIFKQVKKSPCCMV